MLKDVTAYQLQQKIVLSKKNRLTSNSSFIATYHQKRVVSDEFFVLYAGKNKTEEKQETKFGFVVSKKVHKRAIIRNKIKRRLREAVSSYIKENDVNFISMVVCAKDNSVSCNYKDILKSVYALMNKIAKKWN